MGAKLVMTPRSFAFSMYAIIALVFFCAAESQTPPAKQILSVLVPQGLIDADVVFDFERANQGVLVRVESVPGQGDFESRMKTSGVGAWDVVIADENRLVSLAMGRLLRAISNVPPPAEDKFLEKRSSFNADGRMYFPLMADPLVVVWRKNTKTGTAPVTWDSLLDPTENPSWRGRVFVPQGHRFLFRIAMMATGVQSISEPKESLDTALSWMQRVFVQSRRERPLAEWDLFSGRAVSGIMWLDEAINAKHLLPDIEFSAPAKGTLYDRFGVAIAADTMKESLALKFVEYMLSHKKELAEKAGLVGLHRTSWQNVDVSKWKLFEDNEASSKYVDLEIAKILSRY